YFVPAGQWSDDAGRITGSDARHLAAVLRARPGERIIAADGLGRAAVAVFTRVSPDEVGAGLERPMAVTGQHCVGVDAARGLPTGAGERMIAADGLGRAAGAVITRVSPDEVVAGLERPIGETGEPAVRVTVGQGLPKGDKMETVIQKGTEVGAVRFIPFISR